MGRAAAVALGDHALALQATGRALALELSARGTGAIETITLRRGAITGGLDAVAVGLAVRHCGGSRRVVAVGVGNAKRGVAPQRRTCVAALAGGVLVIHARLGWGRLVDGSVRLEKALSYRL